MHTYDGLLIMEAFQTCLPEAVRQVTAISGSFSRHCWRVDTQEKSYILKLNVRKPDEASFHNELQAYELLAQAGVTTPHIIAYSSPPNVLDGFYYIQEWLEGENAAAAVPAMSTAGQEQFAYSFGQAAARLHAIAAPVFSEDPCGRTVFSSWQELCQRRLDRLLIANENCRILETTELYAMEQHIQALLEQTHTAVQPRFTHRDLYLSNAMVQHGQFAAIIDFEAVKFYDPYWDFVKPEMWVFRDYPHMRDPFYEGYEQIAPLHGQFSQRYRICAGLEYIAGIPYFTTIQPNPPMQALMLTLLQEWQLE